MADAATTEVTEILDKKPIEDKSTVDAIHRLLPEMRETRDKIKAVREQLRDIMDQNEEYKQLQEEIKDLSTKRLQARKLLQADSDYQKINADYDDYKNKLKDLQEIMSHYLVTYYNETQKTQIRDNEGETRQVLLSAKMGKPEADMSGAA